MILGSEASRGIWISFVLAVGMVWAETLLETAGIPPDSVFLYNDLLLGSTVAFLGDKFFATNSGYALLKSGQWGRNLTQTLAALSNTEFMRYFVTVFIDALISLPLFVKVLRAYPTMQPLLRRGVKYAIAVITFLTFNNPLRFEWAYSNRRNLDLLVGAFLVTASMTYLNAETVSDPNIPGYAVMNKSSKIIFVAAGWLLFSVYQIVQMGYGVRVPSAIVLGVLLAVVFLGMFLGPRVQSKVTWIDHAIGVSGLVFALVNVVWFLQMTKRSTL